MKTKKSHLYDIYYLIDTAFCMEEANMNAKSIQAIAVKIVKLIIT